HRRHQERHVALLHRALLLAGVCQKSPIPCNPAAGSGVIQTMALATDLKHVFRRLSRSPVFSLVTLVTVAIGIGTNVAIFSIVEGVLLKPLPYPKPDELVGVWQTAPGLNIKDVNAAPFLYFTFREEARTFQDVGLWTTSGATITGLAEPERVVALRITD